MDKKRFKEIESHRTNNDLEILKSTNCVCLSCGSSFEARDVSNWLSEGNNTSALCPKCGLPYVLGDASKLALDKKELEVYQKKAFGKSHLETRPDDFWCYIDRYREGNIEKTAPNEELYLSYLKAFAHLEIIDAILELGSFYEKGSAFHAASLQKAIEYYKSPALRFNFFAFNRLGCIALKQKAYREAFEYFAKSMSLGSYMGSVYYYDLYEKGLYVSKDEEFALNGYLTLFERIYEELVLKQKTSFSSLAQICERLSLDYCSRSGNDANNLGFSNLFLVLARFGLENCEDSFLRGEEFEKDAKDINKRFVDFLNKEQIEPNEPFFDERTFFSSLINPRVFPFVFEGEAKIISAEFDPEEKTLDFTIQYPYPPLIVDVGNAYCGFQKTQIAWHFEHVKEARFLLNTPFKRAISDGFGFLVLSGEMLGDFEKCPLYVRFEEDDQEENEEKRKDEQA